MTLTEYDLSTVDIVNEWFADLYLRQLISDQITALIDDNLAESEESDENTEESDETPDMTPETPDVTPDETPDMTPDETPDVTPDEDQQVQLQLEVTKISYTGQV